MEHMGRSSFIRDGVGDGVQDGDSARAIILFLKLAV